jgi:hypothetical protein
MTPVDDIHPYQSVRGRSLDELAGLVGNAALPDSIKQAARAEILQLQTDAQIEAAKATVRAAQATIKTAAYNQRMVFLMLIAASLITRLMHH